MPVSVQQSSSQGYAWLKYGRFASRPTVSQPPASSLTERPQSSIIGKKSGAASGVSQRPLRGVVQEKGSLARALKASDQAGLSAHQESPPTSGSNGDRSPSRALSPEKLVHSTFWIDPRVRAELEREAKARGMPFSQMGAIACRDWVVYEIHRQQTSLFEEKLRQIVQEEIRSLRDSLVHFVLKTAAAGEHTRIMTTDVYQRMLKAAGVSTERFYELLDEGSEMADNNILNRSPKFTEKLAQWQAAKAAKRKEAPPN